MIIGSQENNDQGWVGGEEWQAPVQSQTLLP